MIRQIVVTAVLAVSLYASSFAQPAKGTNMTDDQTGVLNTIRAMGTLYNSGDIDAVMKTYEESPVVVFEPGKPIIGAAAVRAKFKESLAINPQFTFGKHEVLIAGDLALHLTPWTMTGKVPNGPEVKQSGLSVAVLRRQPNGTWLIVIDNPNGETLLTN